MGLGPEEDEQIEESSHSDNDDEEGEAEQKAPKDDELEEFDGGMFEKE